MLLSDFVPRYALCRDVSADYVEQLTITVNRLEQVAGRALEVSELTDELVNRWILRLKELQAPQTARNKRRSLLTIWKAAAEEGLCGPPGRIRPVKMPEPIVEGWSVAEAGKLLAT